jgi:protein-tyrosine phosphatase
MRILMVCLGNICRSPIAEGVMRHKVKQHGLSWTIESAGTESYHIGEAPHHYSQAVCLAHGIDISGLRARKLMSYDLTNYDKVYAMAHDVYQEIQQIALMGSAPDMSRVDYFLNELYDAAPGSHKKNESVPDPYFGPQQGFRTVFDLIDKTCNEIIKKYT